MRTLQLPIVFLFATSVFQSSPALAQVPADEPTPSGAAAPAPSYQPPVAPAAPAPAAQPSGASASADWAVTFSPAALSARMTTGVNRALVVEAGNPDESTHAAAQALRDGLARSGLARELVDGQILGPVAALDDMAIVSRSANIGADLVMVVRVFPPSQGFSEAVFVSAYGRDGKFVGLSGQRGTPLPVAEPALAPPPAPTYEPAAGMPPSMATPMMQDYARYQAQRIAFDHDTAGGKNIDNYGPYVGIDHRALRGAAFYEKLGRNDLASTYMKRRRVKSALSITGIVLEAAAGISFSLVLDIGIGGTPELVAMVTAVAVEAVGIATMIAGVVVNPAPVSADEARQMAAEYNRHLRERLNLPVDETLPQTEAEPIHYAVVPMANTHGGGLGISARF